MSTRKALAFSFLDRYASLVLSVGSSMVLARLLSPPEIGVFSVTMVLLSFASTFRDLGAGQYLVQERDLTDDRIRAAWLIQLGLGGLLGLLTLAMAIPVATFYGEARMRDIMLLAALGFAINPLGSISYGWLMRSMRYDALAMMRFCATLAGTCVSLYLAWRGWGPVSLAWGALANTCTNAAIGVALRPAGYPWRPGTRELKRVLGFGTRLTSSTLVETTANALPELTLGKLQSMTAVGLYSRANGLVSMFARLISDSVNTVAVAVFAKSARESGDVGAAFLRANAYMTALGWSFALLVLCMAQPMIRVLYGHQWDGAVLATRILVLAFAANLPAALCFQALLAVGATGTLLRTVVCASALSVAGAGLGALHSMEAMTVGLAAGAALASFVWLKHTQAVLGFAWAGFARHLRQSALIALCAGVGPLLTAASGGLHPAQWHLLWLLAAAVSALTGFVAGAFCTGHPVCDELRTVSRSVAARFGRARGTPR